MGDVKTGNMTGAYAQLCSTTKAKFSLEEFTAFVTAQPPITSYSIVGSFANNTNGRDTARVTVQVKSADGGTVTRQIPLEKEGNDWKVCGDPY
jgi:hypothetical protein